MPQTSRIEFALPQAMVVSLQAITSRSTQDLWGTPTTVPGDLSVEQQAQRRASAVGKLSKRISGDLKAKEELKSSLQQWAVTMAIHLAGLVQRVRALGDKVDTDLSEALGEMRAALVQQPSLTTSEQVAAATEAVGSPIWSVMQEQEVLRIAAALRAFGVVEMPSRPPDGGSEVSFGGAFAASPPGAATTLDLLGTVTSTPGEQSHLAWDVDSTRQAGMAMDPASSTPAVGPLATNTGIPGDTIFRPTRWQKRRNGNEGSRPSKSPRRDLLASAPWPRIATGATPEAPRRMAATDIRAEPCGGVNELLPSWESAWRRLLAYTLSQGSAFVGDIMRDGRQDEVLPLQDEGDHRGDLLVAAEELWQALQLYHEGNYEGAFASLCFRLQETLNHLRRCPSALSGVRQGVVVLAQVTVGNLLDPYSYAPSTAQEWLFPTAIAEHGELLRGYIATTPSPQPEVQALLSQRCPAFWEADDGIAELI